MLRKISSFLLLVIFLTNTTNFAFAELSFGASSTNLKTRISQSKENIKKIKNGTRYLIQLNKVDQFINKQTDLDLLEKINLKLEQKKGLAIGKDQLTYELLNYIGLVVEKRIDDLLTVKSADIIKQLDKNTLTKEEIKKVEDEIVKLQINLLDSSRTFIDKLLNDLKKSLNSEEVGNLKLNVEGSGAMVGSGKGELSIKDYKAKAANFDSEFEAQVDLLVEASLVGGKELKTQFSSFVNFISKDGNMYLLLEKLNYSGLDNIDYSGEYTSILDKIKSMGENNQYLKIEDKNSTMLLNMIKNFDLNSIHSEANKVLQEPMLKPYKKDGDKYLLVPTKKACDTIKYINYKISHYGSYTCSDEDYNNMVKKSIIGENIYIIVDGTDKHLGIESNLYGVEGYGKIYSSDKKIEKILFKSEITAGKDKGNLAEINYVNGQKLDLLVTTLTSKNTNTFLSFKSVLTSDNKFSKIDHIWNYSEGNEGFKSSFKLENKKFTGKFNLGDNEKVNLTGTLNGELNSLNDLSAFDLKVNFTEDKEKYNYDWETGKSSSVLTKSIFALNYSLKNEVILGTMSYKENEKELFSVLSNGKYRKEYFELDNKISIVNDFNDQNTNANLNTKFVGNLENNTFDLYIDVDSKELYIKINLTSDSKVEYKEGIEIKAPTNYKTLEELTDSIKGNEQVPDPSTEEFFQ